MGRTEDTARIVDRGLIAIVRFNTAAPLEAVATALADGGVDVIEFTMTTPGALEVLRAASASLGDRVVLGAGTVLDSETARMAILAGARFVVSPTLSRAVITTCRRYDVVSIPGAYSPTEILAAWELGADLVKVFPAGGVGPQFIKDVLAPLPQLKLVPTGGVSLGNIDAFVRAGAAAVAVGSNLVRTEFVAEQDFVRLTAAARDYRAAVVEARAVRASPVGAASS